MCHLTTVDGARTTGTLAYDPDCNVVVKIATETLELRRAGGAGAGAPNSSRGLVITWVSSEVRRRVNGIEAYYHIPRAGEKTTSALARLGSVITKQRARGRGSPFPKTRGPATS